MVRLRAPHLVVVLALAVVSCKASPPVNTPKPSRPVRPASSEAPGPAATPGAGAVPDTVDLLRPGSGSRSLAGTVTLDAGYMVASEVAAGLAIGDRAVVAAGLNVGLADASGLVSKTRLIGDAGGSFAGRTPLVGDNGATLVSKTRMLGPDGAPLVSKTRVIGTDGAPLVSKTRLTDANGVPLALADGNIISDAGGSLIGDVGFSALSNGGARLLGNHAAGLIGKAKYALAAAPAFTLRADPVEPVAALAGADAPQIGALLPAAGVLVGARSLRTGNLVPVGVDAGGRDVFAVYTNLAGGYTFHLPPGEAGNVLVVAVVPSVPDPRVQYAQLTSARPAGVVHLDEDTAQVTRAVRHVAAGRLASIFLEPPSRLVCEIRASKTAPDLLKQPLVDMVEELHRLARAAGVTSDPAQGPAVADLAGRCADALFADILLDQIVCGPAPEETDPRADVTGSPALAVLAELFREARLGTQARLKENPRYFESQPWFQRVTACDAKRYAILKPADFNTVVIEEFLANNSDPGFFYLGDALREMKYPMDQWGNPLAVRRLVRALDAILAQVLLAYVADANLEKTRVRELIAAYDRSAGGSGEGFLTPCPRPLRTPQPQWSPTPTPPPCR